MIQKILQAIKEGNLSWKARLKIFEEIRKHGNLIHISNKGAKNIVYQYRDYKKLSRKYGPLVQKGVEVSGPRVSSNKVWVCWFQGLEQAPDLIKACVRSMEQTMPDKEIVVLTQENYKDYVTLPGYIEEHIAAGHITMAHFSDLLRMSLLAKWGGMWVDSTVLCTDPAFLKYVSGLPLFAFKQLTLGTQEEPPVVASSWFLSCQSNDPIITLTRDLLYAYWKEHDFVVNYLLVHLFFAMSCRRYAQEWEQVPVFNNHSPHVLMFELAKDYSEERWKQIMAMSGVHKLQRYDDYSSLTRSNYSHILNTYLT